MDKEIKYSDYFDSDCPALASSRGIDIFDARMVMYTKLSFFISKIWSKDLRDEKKNKY